MNRFASNTSVIVCTHLTVPLSFASIRTYPSTHPHLFLPSLTHTCKQTIISVSKLVSEIGSGFEASLSLLHTLAETDMRREAGDSGTTTPEAKFWSRAEARNMFVDDVNDLIRRIRTVLIATNEMRQHNDDHERLIDLQYCLAKSYSSNPALRRWVLFFHGYSVHHYSTFEIALTQTSCSQGPNALTNAEKLDWAGVLSSEEIIHFVADEASFFSDTTHHWTIFKRLVERIPQRQTYSRDDIFVNLRFV